MFRRFRLLNLVEIKIRGYGWKDSVLAQCSGYSKVVFDEDMPPRTADTWLKFHPTNNEPN